MQPVSCSSWTPSLNSAEQGYYCDFVMYWSSPPPLSFSHPSLPSSLPPSPLPPFPPFLPPFPPFLPPSLPPSHHLRSACSVASRLCWSWCYTTRWATNSGSALSEIPSTDSRGMCKELLLLPSFLPPSIIPPSLSFSLPLFLSLSLFPHLNLTYIFTFTYT